MSLTPLLINEMIIYLSDAEKTGCRKLFRSGVSRFPSLFRPTYSITIISHYSHTVDPDYTWVD